MGKGSSKERVVEGLREWYHELQGSDGLESSQNSQKRTHRGVIEPTSTRRNFVERKKGVEFLCWDGTKRRSLGGGTGSTEEEWWEKNKTKHNKNDRTKGCVW